MVDRPGCSVCCVLLAMNGLRAGTIASGTSVGVLDNFVDFRADF